MDLDKQNEMPEQLQEEALAQTQPEEALEPENEPAEEAAVVLEEKETETAEPEKKKKKKGLPVWATISICVLTVAVVVLGALFAMDYYKNKSPFKSYTATEKKLIAAQNTVVATAGEHELTNAELQIYYWIYVYNFLEENSYYLSYLGLDYTKDFATQKCYFDETRSWQEYFLEGALAAWHQYITLYDAAGKAGYTLPKEEQEYLDNLKTTMDEQAKKYGFKDGEEMVKKEMGDGATWEAYLQYSKETFIGMGYYSSCADDIKITEEDIAKHYAENTKKYEENKVAMKGQPYCVSVRHILIKPVTKDADGNTIDTETAWETCRQKAQAILDDYLKAGKINEEAFAALAKEKTEDTGSKENGGLYADFTRGKMVEEFEAWSFDAARKYGDTGLVKTTYGYHIMFFVEGNETYSTSVRHILISPVATKDENGKEVITDAAWATCKDKAEKLLSEYLKNGKIDEEAFAALAKANTEDPGSKEEGGLYPQVVRGKMVKEFEDWCFDRTRKFGDTGLVKSTYGYHIMFYVGSEVEWRVFADYDLRMEASKALLNGLKEKAPIDVNYKKILLGHVDLGQ
ncbi:MAG: hypothetical protein E7461_05925 [Ruminococcaceae bacterium]|nr:hypothetical protein [Oscillospiraceae bacterium]